MIAWVGDGAGRGGLRELPLEVPADDPGLMQGQGLFETMRVGADGRLPLFERHLRRLGGSAAAFGLQVPPAERIAAAAGQLLAASPSGPRALRLTLLARAEGVRCVMATRALPVVTLPLELWVSPMRRGGPDPLAAHKTTSRMHWRLARVGAPAGGAEVLVAAADGAVLETETGNLFAAWDGAWVTPPADGRLLPGVARGLLLDGLRELGVAVEERSFDLGELGRARRIVVCNAVRGPRPARLGAGGGGGDSGELGGIWRRAVGGDGPGFGAHAGGSEMPMTPA
jgi:para-aminobenzoate synthetase/4-amino-4-deoxychorismate lyase